eukprot:1965687-Pleurochrysis_carterae.AAC.1
MLDIARRVGHARHASALHAPGATLRAQPASKNCMHEMRASTHRSQPSVVSSEPASGAAVLRCAADAERARRGAQSEGTALASG